MCGRMEKGLGLLDMLGTYSYLIDFKINMVGELHGEEFWKLLRELATTHNGCESNQYSSGKIHKHNIAEIPRNKMLK